MIAAVVLRLRATLLTTDRDFEALPEVPAENWLATPTGGGA
jgi:predicted nucleic acid-binding protein